MRGDGRLTHDLDPHEKGPQDECGVFGVWAPGEDVAKLAYYGLYALQHRGQESAGIATSDGQRISVYKDLGLVSQDRQQRLGHDKDLGFEDIEEPPSLLPDAADTFADRSASPLLQELELPGAGDVTVNDTLRPVSKYFDRVWRPEQLPAALLLWIRPQASQGGGRRIDRAQRRRQSIDPAQN